MGHARSRLRGALGRRRPRSRAGRVGQSVGERGTAAEQAGQSAGWQQCARTASKQKGTACLRRATRDGPTVACAPLGRTAVDADFEASRTVRRPRQTKRLGSTPLLEERLGGKQGRNGVGRNGDGETDRSGQHPAFCRHYTHVQRMSPISAPVRTVAARAGVKRRVTRHETREESGPSAPHGARAPPVFRRRKRTMWPCGAGLKRTQSRRTPVRPPAHQRFPSPPPYRLLSALTDNYVAFPPVAPFPDE